jgi:hypothetical protein
MGQSETVVLFLSETYFKTCFTKKQNDCFTLPHVSFVPTSSYLKKIVSQNKKGGDIQDGSMRLQLKIV